ncbi:MAG: hypothetical protein DDT19_01471 [Syntrophomonadaceae bacterium]|nr:hypothetical protein [Bacillota bacterium]
MSTIPIPTPGAIPMIRDPLRAQGFRTQRAELPEDLWQPLYDRVNYAATGTPELSFFSVVRGQSAPLIRAGVIGTFSKTFRDTNMENANVVPTKMFKFVGISLAYCHQIEGDIANPADRDRIRSGGFLRFRIVDKDILILPLVTFPEVNPFAVGATSTTVTAATSSMLGAAGGGGSNVPMYKLPIPITLNPFENFAVTISLDGIVTTTRPVDVYCILQGFMRRPT